MRLGDVSSGREYLRGSFGSMDLMIRITL